MSTSLTEIIVGKKPKVLSNEAIKPLVTTNYDLSPQLKWRNNSITRVMIKGNCLKQDKITPRNHLNLFIVYRLNL